LAITAQELLDVRFGYRNELETGNPLIFGLGSRGDTELLREAWEVTRDVILPEWTAERPGTRPFAWWKFDHKQERPIVNEWPGFVRDGFTRHGFLDTDLHSGRGERPMQEPECDYLDRNGLLTNAERRALAATP